MCKRNCEKCGAPAVQTGVMLVHPWYAMSVGGISRADWRHEDENSQCPDDGRHVTPVFPTTPAAA